MRITRRTAISPFGLAPSIHFWVKILLILWGQTGDAFVFFRVAVFGSLEGLPCGASRNFCLKSFMWKQTAGGRPCHEKDSLVLGLYSTANTFLKDASESVAFQVLLWFWTESVFFFSFIPFNSIRFLPFLLIPVPRYSARVLSVSKSKTKSCFFCLWICFSLFHSVCDWLYESVNWSTQTHSFPFIPTVILCLFALVFV